MLSKNDEIDYVIILTLISIIIIASFWSMLTVIRTYSSEHTSASELSEDDSQPKGYIAHITNDRLIADYVLPGFSSHTFFVNVELSGFSIYISAFARDIFSIYVYDSYGHIIWSKINKTTIFDHIIGSDLFSGLEIDIYKVKVNNPSPYDLTYYLHLELWSP